MGLFIRLFVGITKFVMMKDKSVHYYKNYEDSMCYSLGYGKQGE